MTSHCLPKGKKRLPLQCESVIFILACRNYCFITVSDFQTMPSSCCVKDCRNRHGKDNVDFYRFPMGKSAAAQGADCGDDQHVKKKTGIRTKEHVSETPILCQVLVRFNTVLWSLVVMFYPQ